jgi:hypothetical protein
MQVTKITSPSGTFYNEDYSPELLRQTVLKVPDWTKIERVEMTAEEYAAIPATAEAARLWA